MLTNPQQLITWSALATSGSWPLLLPGVLLANESVCSNITFNVTILSLFAWTYQHSLSAMVQCFPLTTNKHQLAFISQISAKQISISRPNHRGYCRQCCLDQLAMQSIQLHNQTYNSHKDVTDILKGISTTTSSYKVHYRSNFRQINYSNWTTHKQTNKWYKYGFVTDRSKEGSILYG